MMLKTNFSARTLKCHFCVLQREPAFLYINICWERFKGSILNNDICGFLSLISLIKKGKWVCDTFQWHQDQTGWPESENINIVLDEMVKIVYINHTWSTHKSWVSLTPKMPTVHCSYSLLVTIIYVYMYIIGFSIKLSKKKKTTKQQSGNHKLAMQYDQSTFICD